MNPHYHLHPPPRAILTVVVRAQYTLASGLVIVVVVHQHHWGTALEGIQQPLSFLKPSS
jgi:hypothetical protein